MSKLKKIGLILLVGVLIRGIWLGQVPAGISDDEASHGYNAYSLLTTGRDEYGKAWPIFIRSFGTYASSLYTYMTVPSVKFLGLNIFSTRLPSAVSGIILVLVASIINPVFGLVVALSPVFVFYSRAAFETNLALTILFLGLVLTTRSITKPTRLVVGMLVISLSAYGYHVERILSLLSLVALTIYLRNKASRMALVIGLSLALLIQVPLFTVSFTPGAGSRAATVGNTGGVIKKLLDSSFLFSTYFSPNNLFSRPDPAPNKSYPTISVFYWWMLFPLIAGIILVFRRKLTGLEIMMALLGISSAVIAATTKDYFSTWRALPFFLFTAYIISLGMRAYKFPLYILIISISLLSLCSNLVLQKFEQSASWGYHYDQVAQFVKSHPGSTIVIDSARSSPIYIWLAFYNQIDPSNFQKGGDAAWLANYYDHIDYQPVSELDRVQIRPIYWEGDVYQDQIIISDSLGISASQIQEHKLIHIHQFVDTRGQPVLNAYQTSRKPIQLLQDPSR